MAKSEREGKSERVPDLEQVARVCVYVIINNEQNAVGPSFEKEVFQMTSNIFALLQERKVLKS